MPRVLVWHDREGGKVEESGGEGRRERRRRRRRLRKEEEEGTDGTHTRTNKLTRQKDLTKEEDGETNAILSLLLG